MDKKEIISGLLQELRRGTIVLCVLSRLKQSMYGYNLIRELDGSGITIEANTLYPLLRRLEGQGLLESRWETSEAKPRKYYQTTALGNEVCTTLWKCWNETAAGMNTLYHAEQAKALQTEKGDNDNE